jgi:hypothetical protein
MWRIDSDFNCTDFVNCAGQKCNPKNAWKSINHLLGKQSKHEIVNKLNLGENILNNPTNIAEGFNEYFSNIGPDLASKINMSNNNFETYLEKAKSEIAAFQLISINDVLHGLSSNKATGIIKFHVKLLPFNWQILKNREKKFFSYNLTLFRSRKKFL